MLVAERQLKRGEPRWADPAAVADGHLVTGFWYRTIFYKDDHLLDPRWEPKVALCGRPLESDAFKVLDGAAVLAGTTLNGFVYRSERKGGKCAECKSVWGDKEKRKAIEAEAEELRADRQAAEDARLERREQQIRIERRNPHRRIRRHQETAMTTLLKHELGAEVVEEVWV